MGFNMLRLRAYSILKSFIKYKRARGFKGEAIIESRPDRGVYLGQEFYSLDNIVKAIETTKNVKIEVIL